MVTPAVKATLTYGKQLAHEKPQAHHIPYLRHVSDNVLITKDGLLISVIKLEGLSFQTLDQHDINQFLENRNTLFKGMSSSKFSLYGHVIRREVDPVLDGDFDNAFLQELNTRYMAGLGKRRQFVNEMYLTVIRRPMQGHLGLIDRIVTLFAGSVKKGGVNSEALTELLDTTQMLERDFQRYGARTLTVEKRDNGFFSEPCEFLAKILSAGEQLNIPLPRMSLDAFLPTRRIFFGKSAIEFRKSQNETKFASIISIREYPPFTGPGMLDDLLNLPHEMVITQSFVLTERSAALQRMNTIDRRVSGSDASGTSIREGISSARDGLMQGHVAYGHHHLTIMGLSNTPDALGRVTSDIGAELTNKSIVWVKEDLNLEPAFWAQLPGNFSYIARGSLISSSNFAGFFSAHNFPVGQRTKLQWRTPIALLETTSQTPYWFNYHSGELGNFTVIGPSGSGKTVVMAFLLAQTMRVRPRPRCVFFDKDRGAEIFIRAIGGQYAVLNSEEPTGWNPFQLVDTDLNREFLITFSGFLVRPDDRDLTTLENRVVAEAVSNIYDLNRTDRNLANFRELLKGRLEPGMDDLASRLDPWLMERGWLFNNPKDELDWSNPVAAFDMTRVLDDPKNRTAALLYIFHRVLEILDGTPAVIFLDEGWKLLSDRIFVNFIQDMLKTIRKQNGVIGFGTQSAADVVNSPIAQTLIEQTSTNIFFPNSKADENSYKSSFGLTEKEFQFIRTTPYEKRRFIVRHAQDSVIVQLDLGTMPDVLKVLSGRKETIIEMEHLIKEHGKDPSDWLPEFCGWEV